MCRGRGVGKPAGPVAVGDPGSLSGKRSKSCIGVFPEMPSRPGGGSGFLGEPQPRPPLGLCPRPTSSSWASCWARRTPSPPPPQTPSQGRPGHPFLSPSVSLPASSAAPAPPCCSSRTGTSVRCAGCCTPSWAARRWGKCWPAAPPPAPVSGSGEMKHGGRD